MLAAEYGNVYVASIALGCQPAQAITAIREAEEHRGPSIIIAYAPCINHGIVKGMAYSQAEAKLAVESGYWFLFRYKPELKAEGKNPFILDSKAPASPWRTSSWARCATPRCAAPSPSRRKRCWTRPRPDSAARYQKYLALSQR